LDRAEAEALQALASLSQVLEPESQQRLSTSCNKLLEDIRGQKKTKEKNIKENKLNEMYAAKTNQDQDKTVIANGSQEKIVLANQRQEKEERDTENTHCCAESEHEVKLARNIVEDVDWEKEEEWIRDRNVLVSAFSSAVEIRWVVDRKKPSAHAQYLTFFLQNFAWG
jgi:hypothetical protein